MSGADAPGADAEAEAEVEGEESAVDRVARVEVNSDRVAEAIESVAAADDDSADADPAILLLARSFEQGDLLSAVAAVRVLEMQGESENVDVDRLKAVVEKVPAFSEAFLAACDAGEESHAVELVSWAAGVRHPSRGAPGSLDVDRATRSIERREEV